MMKIEYFGHSCFRLTAKDGVTLLTDPYRGVGYELPSPVCADIVTVSHGHFDHNYTAAIDAKRVVDTVGCFYINGVEIEGILTDHDEKQGTLRGKNIVYKIRIDGITLCHMGDIGEECTPQLLEKIGKVDLLFIPVGGTYTVDAIGAKKYADALAPKAVIPMHYKPSDGSLDITTEQPFLSLYATEEVTRAQGVMQIDGETSGIIFMERIRDGN